MKFTIKHELKNRIRIHLNRKNLSIKEADVFEAYLSQYKLADKAKVYERTADAVICYSGERNALIDYIKAFNFNEEVMTKLAVVDSGRELNAQYKDKLVTEVLVYYGKKLFLPAPVRTFLTIVRSFKYIKEGLKSILRRKMEVAILDATAITVSMLRSEFETASSVMFLLGIGELLEEWTHKKSVGDLARSMSLNVKKVWLLSGDQEVLVETSEIKEGDQVVVHMGNVIPFDGIVTAGEGMVNQSSMTGEPLPVHKSVDGAVFAGTVLEEGELTLLVKKTNGDSRYEKIVKMIEESEKLKSSVEGKALKMADRLVPYTLGGTVLTYLLTRNATKAMSVLMVDFSCALKLAMPISVLSAIRESGKHSITVKGGKYMEAVSQADTIVFDKTGTLTKARPTVKNVIPFCDMSEVELLRIAACLEEHFPHSMAKAVMIAAKERNIQHEEMHSKVEYVVAHGIASSIDNRKVVIGSSHFVFEDEKCQILPEYESKMDELLPDCSHLYLAMDGQLIAVIQIEDPIREEAREAIEALHQVGFKNIVMMTGDSERTAKAVAEIVGVDQYYSEVLPEDKANFVMKEKEKGHTVMMIGDGINDSPALSAANVGIAISDGAEIAREIADITITADDLREIVMLKRISNGLMKRINKNYRDIVAINGFLIFLGIMGMIAPTTSATLHNISTIAISTKNMTDIVGENK